MKLNRVTKNILTLVVLFSLSTAFAKAPVDPDPVPDDPINPLNPAPIGDYLIPMLVFGMATAFVLLRKKKFQNV